MSLHRFHVWAGIGTLFVLLCVGGSVLTARQEPTNQNARQPGRAAENEEAPQAAPWLDEKMQHEVDAAVDKMFEAFDLKPHSLPAIPDNPPPHEGTMINYPLLIEPPDLILIEVLEALPGRPISGERLVRPDGMISLGFYGEVHVAGLTLDQAKVKIIKHLRKFLSDEGLGLFNVEPEFEEGEDLPTTSPEGRSPLEMDREQTPEDEAKKPSTVPSSYKVRPIRQSSRHRSSDGRSRPKARVKVLARRQDQDEKKPDKPRNQVKIPVEAGGKIVITIEVQNKENKEEVPAPEVKKVPPWKLTPPDQCDRVFVDVTAYNSKNYFVLGDVATPGRLPFTGNETVLDALQYGGGLLHTAEPKDIHLVRPARGGKPAHVYKVDLEAIQNRGDTTTNYQIFPGDRLVVGRNDVVKKTIQLDRLAAPLQTAVNSILQESFMLRSVQAASPDHHGEILKNLVEFWVQALKQTDGVKFDENTLRDALIKKLK